MDKSYNPRSYWENRLSDRFDLRGVGHIAFGQGYNKWLYRRKKYVLSKFLGNRSLTGKSVLDIGCGTGFFVSYFIDKGAEVFGVDLTEISVKQLRQKFSGDFSTQDIGSKDFVPPAIVDIVNVWDVLYHVVEDNAFSVAAQNMASSIKPGGLLLLNDFLAATEDHVFGGHVKGRTLGTYRNALQKLGFVLVETTPLYRFLDTNVCGKLDNYFGGLYFAMDMLFSRLSKDALCFSAWRYEP